MQIQLTCYAVGLLYYSGTFIVRDPRSQMADIMRISLTEESVDNTCQMFEGVRQKCLTSGGWSTSRNIRNCDEDLRKYFEMQSLPM